MFYRQKSMLALIESFGGALSNTDLEKLLFLFCQTVDNAPYAFFPYKFGPFSFESYFDKRKLIEKGFLKNTDGFELVPAQSYFNQLKNHDRIKMRSFSLRNMNLRGQSLIHKVYTQYPEFAVRSEIVGKVLSTQELSYAARSWNQDHEMTLFTIGYEGTSIDNYLYRLIRHNICVLVDVRKNPLSRKHGFSKKSLSSYLNKVGIEYIHLPELGIPSSLRQNLSNKDSYVELFDHYAENILPLGDKQIEIIRTTISNRKRVAITCFEAEHKMCHRHKISDYFAQSNNTSFKIRHI